MVGSGVRPSDGMQTPSEVRVVSSRARVCIQQMSASVCGTCLIALVLYWPSRHVEYAEKLFSMSTIPLLCAAGQFTASASTAYLANLPQQEYSALTSYAGSDCWLHQSSNN